MRTFANITMLLGALALATVPALAQNAHFVEGPTSTQADGELTACATIAGLGNTETDITLSCLDVSFQCINRAGNINNAHETLTSTKQFQPHSGVIKNACVSIEATCPRGQARPANVEFSGCTYTVTQSGQQVLSEPVP
jgi:hypothetical protein